MNYEGNIEIDGNDSIGIYADIGSKIILSGDLTASGDRSNGIRINEGCVLDMSGDVSAFGEKIRAILIWDNSIANISGDVTVSGDNSFGIWSIDDSKITFSGDVSASGEGSRAVYTQDRSKIIMTGDIEASGAASTGIFSCLSGTVYIDGDISVSGYDAGAVTAYENGAVYMTGDIVISGEKSTGICADTNSDVDIHGDMIVSGANSQGIFSYMNSDASISGNLTVSGAESTGIYAYWDAYANVNGDIMVSGAESQGILAYVNSNVNIGGDMDVSGDGSMGIFAYWDSNVGISGDIAVSGNSVFGAYAQDSSTIRVRGDVIVSGATSLGLHASSGSAVYMDGNILDVSGDRSIALHTESGGAIMLSGVTADSSANGQTLLYTTSSGSVYADKGSELIGNVNNSNNTAADGELNLYLAGASSLTGTINDNGSRAYTNVTLAGENDAWHVTGTSTIRGSLDNSGVVNYMLSPSFTNVTVGYLGADGGTGGTYIMKTDIVHETADNLIVTKTTNGSYKITVNNDGAAATTGEELTTLVRTADQNGSFELSHLVEAGAWQYSLRQVTYAGGNAIWELYANGASNPGSDAVNSFYASYLLGYAHMETLIKRLGDLRETPDENGVWARLHGGKFESKAGSYAKPFDMKYWGVHVGYDRKLEYKGWDGDSYAGVFFGWGKGDIDYLALGDGDAELKEVGVYGTWLRPNGFFADLVLKYQWIDNDFRAIDSAGDIVTGSGMTTGGFGGSLELGQRIHFADRENRERKIGWYVEPQVQLSIMRYKGDYFRVSNGMVAGADGFTSIIGRLGALVGYENESKTSNLYLKAFRLREFEADINAYINGARISDSYKGSWWVYGLGYTGKINDRDSIYLDIERTSGAKFDQLWSARLGWRHTF